MRNSKSLLLLLLNLLLITACAFFPQIVSAFQDSNTLGQAHSERIPTVQLQLHPSSDSPSMAKLALMDRMDGSIEIPDSMAAMTCTEAEQAAFTALQRYIDAGLVRPFETFAVEVRCLFGQALGNADLSAVYWSVSITGDPEAGFFFADLAIDDETGDLLRINCTLIEAISETAQEHFLTLFADVYFNGLDIANYRPFATADLKDHFVGDNAHAVRYRFGDVIYGEVNVDLYVYEYGFYTEFPNLERRQKT